MDYERPIIITLLVSLTTGCAAIAEKAFDWLGGSGDGIAVEAQVGDTDNKVKAGVGSVGDKITNETSIENGSGNTIDSSSGRYHIKSDKEVTVNVYETNRWLYAIFAAWLLGKPALRWLGAWRQKRKAANISRRS